MVGGLEKPDGGEIHLGDQCLVAPEKNLFIKPEKRNMGMVFQSYALWPHMTVFENVAYPLKLRGIKGAEARRKSLTCLALVGLAGLEERPAPALSGGQQQRVALARALVFSPKVLLLDEPLSNLDAQLREEMRRELKSLQQRVNITVIFVTHDQIEALSLSDRIAIMKFGVLEQVGTPEDVYFRPATPFVRDFLGKTFLLPGKISASTDQSISVEVQGFSSASLNLPRTKVIGSVERIVSRRPRRDRGDPSGEGQFDRQPAGGPRQHGRGDAAIRAVPRRPLRVHRHFGRGYPGLGFAGVVRSQVGRPGLSRTQARGHDAVAEREIDRGVQGSRVQKFNQIRFGANRHKSQKGRR